MTVTFIPSMNLEFSLSFTIELTCHNTILGKKSVELLKIWEKEGKSTKIKHLGVCCGMDRIYKVYKTKESILKKLGIFMLVISCLN